MVVVFVWYIPGISGILLIFPGGSVGFILVDSGLFMVYPGVSGFRSVFVCIFECWLIFPGVSWVVVLL